jgi:hypothetical protein
MTIRIIATCAAMALLGSGCIIVPGPRVGVRKSCPPGHQWSDGRCHSTGKGHDSEKHKDKKTKKKQRR